MQRFFTSLLLTVVMCFVTCNYALARKPRTVFNDDAQFLFEMENIEDPVGFVKAWLDREMNAIPFSTFVFLAATPDVCTYEAKVGEVYADRRLPGGATGWAPGIRSLRAAGTDALKLVTEHMKAHGKEVLAAIRLSDTHHVNLNPNDPLVPQFAIDNPQFVIKQPDGRENETALDYSYPEVRAHRLAIMREIVENYDVDGLELNFVRWAKHFPRHQGREKAPIMTDFMQSVRSMLDEVAESKGRKRPFTLGIRVPESIDTCWLAGVDIETWVNNDWISYIVVSTWNNTDPQMGLAEFTRFAKPNKVDLIVVMGNMMGGMATGEPFILDRSEAYIGVMIDDVVTKGVAEPYRMFTSRAEYRLRLRIDNADQRLTELGYKIGVVSKKRWSLYSQKKNKLKEAYKVLTDLSLTPDEGIKKGLNIRKDGVRRTASELLSFPDISFKEISGIWPKLFKIEPKIALQLEIECQYAIYIERQKNDIETYRKDSKLKIPKNIDYSSVGSLSNEAKEVLKKAKPETIAQASSLPGITPAAIGAVIIHMRQLAA